MWKETSVLQLRGTVQFITDLAKGRPTVLCVTQTRPEQEPSQGCDSRRRRGVAHEKLQEREFRASREGKHKSRERRAEAARETGMNSRESEVNHGKTRGGQCQTGRQILSLCQYTALYIVLWVKTHTHTCLHTNHKEGRSWPLNKRTRL